MSNRTFQFDLPAHSSGMNPIRIGAQKGKSAKKGEETCSLLISNMLRESIALTRWHPTTSRAGPGRIH